MEEEEVEEVEETGGRESHNPGRRHSVPEQRPGRQLWPMEDPCESRAIPGGTVAHGEPTVKQR